MLSPKPAISRALGTYGLLICIGYAVDVAAYGVLLAAGANLYVAYIASFAIGTVCNVALLRRYFRSGRHAFMKDLAMTFASNGAMLVAGVALYAALMAYAAMVPLAAKVASNGATFVVNYVIRRRFF